MKLATLRAAFVDGQISAERFRDSLSKSPVFADLDAANRAYLQAVDERDLWRDSTKAVFAQLGRVEEKSRQQGERVSDLERELNGVRNADAEAVEVAADNRPFLNIGFGKKMKRVAEEIRAGRVKR